MRKARASGAELKAFPQSSLKSGEAKQVVLEIAYDSLGYYDWDMNWILYEGKLNVFVGGNVRDTLEKEILLR